MRGSPDPATAPRPQVSRFCCAEQREGDRARQSEWLGWETGHNEKKIPNQAQIQGCRVVRLNLDSKWQWDADAAAELRKTTRIFFVPNPNSPTGTLWTAEQLRQLLPERGVLVLDEAYGDFC